jgi:hypothetical protein
MRSNPLVLLPGYGPPPLAQQQPRWRWSGASQESGGRGLFAHGCTAVEAAGGGGALGPLEEGGLQLRGFRNFGQIRAPVVPMVI